MNRGEKDERCKSSNEHIDDGNIGEVSTTDLTYSFDEDYEKPSTMKFDPTYIFNRSGTDSMTETSTRKIYDYSTNNNDGILCAGPGGQYGTMPEDEDNAYHDHPQRTANSLYGRAIDFWIPPDSQYPPVSTCRYIRTPLSPSLWYQNIESSETLYVDFEFYLWPYRDIELDNDPPQMQVIINNLWKGYTSEIPVNMFYEGYYRIMLDPDHKLVFEYLTSDIGIPPNSVQIRCDQSLDLIKWSRINIRFEYSKPLGENNYFKIDFYIDGKLASTHISYSELPDFIHPQAVVAFTIGADPYSVKDDMSTDVKQFYGMIDELRISRGTPEKIGKCLFFIDYDEMGGDISLDQTNLNNDAYLYPAGNNGKWGSDGVYGGYLNCVDSSYYSVINDPNDDEHHPQELSVEAWIKPKNDWDDETQPLTSHTNIVSKAYYSSSQPYYSFHLKIHQNRTIIFGIGASNPNADCAVVSKSTVPLKTWTHVAGTFKNGVAKIYIDGNLDNTTAYSWSGRSIRYNNKPFMMGKYRHQDQLAFPGKIDQVGLYNYAKEYTPEIIRLTFEDGDGSQSIPTSDWTNYNNGGQLINGAIIINNGKYNKCVYLPDDETDPHVRIDLDTDPDNVDYIGGVFTVDCWVKPDPSLSDPSVIASQYNSWELGMDDDHRPYFKVRETGGNWITAKHPLPLIGDYNGETDHNSWHHVMGVFKADQIYLFLDGKSGYRSGNIHSIRSFSGYTRQVSSSAIYLGVRWTGSVYEDQYYGSIDSFRLRKGVYDLNEDTDGDNMADKYEIIRSLHSDQFDPFVHNTRFATLLSGVNFQGNYIFEDRHFKIDAYDNYNTLKKLGYDDDDIIYLDHNTLYQYQNISLDWGQSYMYENGEWIDGEATKNNVRALFSQLSVGGNLTLEYPDFTTRVYTVPKIESDDNYYRVSNCHGGEEDVNISDPPGSEPQFYFGLSEQLQSFPSHNQVNYYETEFISDLSGLDFKYASIIVSACHSSLLHFGYYNVKADNRIIITPTDNSQGGTSYIPYLYWSSRISGNSSSYFEWANQYCNPSNTIYNNDLDLLKLIKYHLNGDDMETWSIAQQNPLDVDIIYKGYNTRNVCVSIQEAFMIADMWVNILNGRNPPNSVQQGGSPMMSEGDDVPNQMMI